MVTINFYQLSRDAQERFVGSVNGTGKPAPILGKRSLPLPSFGWFGVSVACFCLLLIVISIGYGDVTSGMGRQNVFWLIVDAGLSGGFAYGLLRAVVLFRVHDASPFRHGLYMFPVGLIDARKPILCLYPIEDLAGVSGGNGSAMTLDFGDAKFAFRVQDAEVAEAAKSSLTGARSAMGDAGAARESVRPTALAALDPLQGYATPFSPPSPMLPPRVEWAGIAWVFAVLAGVVLGGSFWAARNARSDEAMYDHAVTANDTETFEAYLKNGLRHSTDVSSVLLPRARLRDAVKIGTVEAIEQFIKEHPQSAVAGEATAALRIALLAELDVAAKAGTIAALDDFTRRHPRSHLEPEWNAARHRVYQAAYEHYMEALPDKTAPAAVFVQRLLAWAEVKGPKVELRYHLRRSKGLDKADVGARRSRQFKGVVSQPSQYFTDDAEKADKDALTAVLSKRFADTFPPELLALSAGDPLPDPDAALPAQIAVPTLFVDMAVNWAGSMQASAKPPHGVFAGVELVFDALFRVPGFSSPQAPDDTKPLKLHVDGWHPPDMASARDAENPEQVVYAAVRAKGFDQFQKKLLVAIFPGPAGSK